MKVAVYQGEGVPGAPDENIEIMREAVAEAATAGAELIVFPELFLTGYNIPGEVESLAEGEGTRATKRMIDLAQNYAIAILYGYVEKEGEDCYNSARLILRDGSTLLNHRKCQPYGDYEKGAFQKGDSFEVADFTGFKVGILICYEVEFPETARQLARSGANLILVSSATSAQDRIVPQLLAPARAAENQVFLVFANRCGSEGGLSYSGKSRIFGPSGETLAALEGEEGLIIADLDPALIDTTRARYCYLDDLRDEIYRCP